jgi:hypothetical protein
MASGSKGGRRAPSTGRGQRAGHGVAACAALLIVGACGQRPGAILEPGPDAPAWPAPPDEARIRYLGEFRTNQDLKPGRSFIQGRADPLRRDARDLDGRADGRVHG